MEVMSFLAMANSEAGMSSDAAQALGSEYQVFLNFRGPDTRYGFTDFLYHGLLDAGVRVFRDDEELRVGEVIGGELLRAIDNSILYILIFSQTYAFSKWCLRELVRIVDNVSKSEGQKSILPIFFHVEPEDVKLKTLLYSNALLEHTKEFPNEVEVWRKSLAEVDEIKGWNVKKDQGQAKIVKSVVEKVLEMLEIKHKSVIEDFIGLDDRVKVLKELLDVNHLDVRVIGIYGMGGIGKTTLATVVFNQLSSHFGKYCSFLDNVRETSLTKKGIIWLQKKLLSNTGFVENIEDSEKGMRRIGDTLRTKKVLVVLDDVDNKEHIKKLIGNSPLHSGSRIVITTRNKSVLEVEGFEGKILLYEMLKMDTDFALQLFRRHAFGRDCPLDDYHRLSSEIVSRTGGLPLAIKVIGSLLNGKNKAFWGETLVRLRNILEEEILKKLRISYDDLDEYQQQIFLDIACFFFNEKKTDAIYMWAGCQFYPERGIDVLISRCLIKILDNDKFWMHDQLIELGRQIIRQESASDLGNRSRLWIAKEALQIIRSEERQDKVQALEIDGLDDSIEITNEELERLQNLRFLKLGNGTFAGDFAKCRSKLRWVSWHSPHQDFRADDMYLEHLLVFKLDMNDFTDDSKAWELIEKAQKLKVLSLTGCHGITTIPNFSKCLSLERLTLARCSRLKRIESFIGDFHSLIELEIEVCTGLTNLPKEVGALVNLTRFSLQGCSGLRELPDLFRNLTSLIELDLSRTGIAKLPNSIEGLVKLESFLLIDTRIRELPNSIGKLKSLRILRLSINGSYSPKDRVWQLCSGISTLENLEELDLSGRYEVKGEVPIEIGELSSLKILNLRYTRICGIPRTINRLHHLQTLNLLDCNEIKELPELPTSLTCLLVRSKSLLSVPTLSNLTNLVELQLSDGSRIEDEAKLSTGCNLSWIGRLSRLKKLKLNLLNVLAPPELAFLSHLEELVLKYLDLKPLVQLPSSDWSWRNLLTLVIDCCEVEEIPLEGLPRLEKLTIHDCLRLLRLSIPSELRKLQQVDVSGCRELVDIQVVGLSKSLEYLGINDCKSLTRISGLSYLKNLKTLKIKKCNVLTNVEGLDELESLKSLRVERCTSLRWLIDAFCTKILDDCVGNITWCGDSINDSRSPSRIPAPPGLASISHLEELNLSGLDPKPLVQLPSSDWSWRNLSNLKLCRCEVEDIPLEGLSRLERFSVVHCVGLQRLSIPLELRKLRQVDVSKCPELVEIQVVGLLKSLEYLSVDECKSLTRISGLSYLKNLEILRIEYCNVLTDVEGLNELVSLKSVNVGGCTSLRRLLDVSCTNIPDDCLVKIQGCGDSIKDSTQIDPSKISLKHYREKILLDTSDFESKPDETIYEGDQETEDVPGNRDVGGATRVASSSGWGTASSSGNGAAFSSGSGRDSSSRNGFDFRKRFPKFKTPACFRRL